MIGIVIIAHNYLSEAIKSVAEHVIGPLPDVLCVNVLPEDDIEQKRAEIDKKIKQVNQEKGVVLLTDMFGGTPSNLAISLMQEGKVEVISGMNVPLLVKLIRERKKPLLQAVKTATESGQHYMMIASDFLEKKNDKNLKKS